MQKAVRWLGWTLLGLLGLAVAAPLLLAGALEFSWGQEALRRLVVQATGVGIASIEGSPLRRTTLRGVALRDAGGTWLDVGRATLAWDISALLHRTLSVQALEVEGVTLSRLPAAGAPAEPAPASGPPELPGSLPVAVRIDAVQVADVRIAAAITGADQPTRIDASAHAAFDRAARGEAALDARFSGPGEGQARLSLRRDALLSLRLQLAEPARGFIAALAGLPALGALEADVSAEGPPDAATVTATLKAGAGIEAKISGRLDVQGNGNDLALSAQASAASLAAVAGQPVPAGPVALDARITGRLETPRVQASVVAENVTPPAPATPLGTVRAEATVALQPDGGVALEQVAVTADALSATGSGSLPAGGTPQGTVQLTIPSIRALADVGVAGGIAATATAGADGWIGLQARLDRIEGPGPVAVLLGETATLAARARIEGANARIETLTLDGHAIALAAHGTAGERLDLAATLSLPFLTALAPELDGSATAQIALSGPAADPDARVTLDVPRIAVAALPPGAIRLSATARTLASRPDVQANGDGAVAGENLSVAVRVQPQPDGAIALPRAAISWGEARIDASGSMQADGRPDLSAEVKIPSLEPLGALLGQALRGAIVAQAAAHPAGDGIAAKLTLEATQLVLPGARAARIGIEATAEGAMTAPVLDARIALQGVAAGGLVTGGSVTLRGPPDALAIAAALDGADHALRAEARAELPARVKLSALSARWQTESLRLASPATVTLDPPSVDRLVLDRAGGGQIEARGSAGERLDLSVRIARLPLAIAAIFVPDMAPTGTLDAEAKITGTPAAPEGRVTATVRGAGLPTTPKADMTAEATLSGGQLRANATLTSGANARLTLVANGPMAAPQTGRATIDGTISLALLDPLLAPDGRQARGTIRLSLAAENQRLSGEARIADARFSDGVLGVALGGINGTVSGQGEVLRVDISARTGAGSLSLAGTVRPMEPGMPVDLRLAADNARIAMGEQLAVRFGADLHTTGGISGTLGITGRIDVAHADIAIPDRMPPNVVELPVVIRGAPPAPPPAPAAGPKDIRLDVAINAPRAVFVRGQGLDAEMGGALQLRGTASDPRISGELSMRRGTLDRLGQTFTFRRGKIDFDGGQGFDPTLDFEAAREAAGLTALILVTGRPSSLKIQLASEPDAPSDEVLSRLLFGRGRGALSAAEAIQLARAAAELSGLASPGGGVVDRLRAGLGLDRLSVGADDNGKPSVEAGRYVAEGVYLGARQTGDGSTQATIQLEIVPGFSVGADIGGQSNDRVNATIGFDY